MLNSPRNAIVTGAASGMGLGVATELVRRGFRVALWDLDGDKLQRAVAEIGADEGRVSGHRVDVTSVEQVEAAARLPGIGPIHVLVNCAGLTTFAPLEETTEAMLDREIAVNLKGTFICIRAVVPGMRSSRWGRIVNIASLAGQAGVTQLTAYSAAKAGVIGLTKAVAHELASDGITCNCICPGPIDTPMLRGAFKDGDLTVEFSKNQGPMRRLGTVDEIVAACTYFISEEAAFTTGQILGVNGGAYI